MLGKSSAISGSEEVKVAVKHGSYKSRQNLPPTTIGQKALQELVPFNKVQVPLNSNLTSSVKDFYTKI